MKLILFDFDGVLANTLLMCYGIHQELNPEMEYKFFQDMSKGNFFEGYEKAKNAHKIIPNPDFHSLYRERMKNISMPQELKELVVNLSKEYILCIVSSTPTSSILHFLEREAISDKFKLILGSDVHTSKTEKINRILIEYNLAPKDTLFITDTTGDIMEARKCDVPSVGVTWGLHDRKYLMKENPLFIVDTPEELNEKIKEFFAKTK